MVAKTVKEAREKIAVAVEMENDRMARSPRNVPDEDFLAVRRGQNMFFGFREAGLLWRRADDGGDREQKRAWAKNRTAGPQT